MDNDASSAIEKGPSGHMVVVVTFLRLRNIQFKFKLVLVKFVVTTHQPITNLQMDQSTQPLLEAHSLKSFKLNES